MSDVTTVIKEHPVAAGGILIGVAVLAYLQSRASGGPQSQSYQYRGEIAAGIDPNAAAIEQAAINAGTANLGTIAQLAGLQDTNRTALTGSLAQTSAARDVQLAQTSATKDTTLANIAANLKASLFATEAQRDTSLAQTDATKTTSLASTSAQLTEQLAAAQYNADIARQQIAAATTANTLQHQTDLFAIQSQKDIARAQANTSIFGSILGGALAFFGL